MNEFDLIIRFKSDEDSITLRSYIADNLLEDKLFDNLEMWDFKRSEVLSILNLRKENAELKAKSIIPYQEKGYVFDEDLHEIYFPANGELMIKASVVEELKAKLKEGEVFIENIVKASADNPNEFFELRKENKELREQISTLLSCSNCPDNKGGYVCEKEYNDKCLAQKIQYIKELKEEIEKMKKYCGCEYCINVVSGDEFTVENTNKTVCEYCMENNKKFWKSAE